LKSAKAEDGKNSSKREKKLTRNKKTTSTLYVKACSFK